MSASSIVLLGMCNPLLDLSVHTDKAYLDKYGLQENLACLAEEKHFPMYAELAARPDVEYIVGGAGQNSIRVAQWMLGGERQTAFVGCVGHDAYATTLHEMMEKANVATAYLVDEKTPTGTCAVLVTEKNRTLCANIAAASQYKVEHLDQPDVWALVEQAKIYYVTGFFITSSPQSILKIGAHAAEKNKIFTMNLSAPFISQVPFFKDSLMQCSLYWDILFGNETEAEAFSVANGWNTTDLKEIALKVAALPKHNTQRSRIVVFTHGAEPTTVAVDGVVTEYPILAVPHDKIVDTNGAGDAFVAGFLAELVHGKAIEACVAAGHWAASIVIQQSGATVPEVCEYKA